MQGPVFFALVIPAAWKHLRTLMPSHSIHQGPSPSMAAVRCVIGEGAESGAGPSGPSRESMWERDGSPINTTD